MDKLEYTVDDVSKLIKLRPDFAMALENVVLKRLVEEMMAQKYLNDKPKVTAIGNYKNGK